MKRFVLFLCLLLLVTLPAQAEIKGYVAVDYDTMSQDWTWTLSVDKHLTSWWLVGTSMATCAPDYGFKHFIPAWIPHRLDYEIYTEVRLGEVSLRLTSWCDHWFSQSDVGWLEDKHGLKIQLRYDF